MDAVYEGSFAYDERCIMKASDLKYGTLIISTRKIRYNIILHLGDKLSLIFR